MKKLDVSLNSVEQLLVLKCIESAKAKGSLDKPFTYYICENIETVFDLYRYFKFISTFIDFKQESTIKDGLKPFYNSIKSIGLSPKQSGYDISISRNRNSIELRITNGSSKGYFGKHFDGTFK